MSFGIKFHGGDDESGGVFAVETIARAGTVLQSHKHEHSHMSVLVCGSAVVEVDGKKTLYDGYSLINIPSDTFHKVEAVTDIIWLCLWADGIAPKQLAEDSLKLVPVDG